MPKPATIVPVGFLTDDQLQVLRVGLRRSLPAETAGEFTDLLKAVDEADQAHKRRSCAVPALTV